MRHLDTLVGALTALGIVVCFVMTSVASTAVPVQASSNLVFSSTSLAPVYIHFKPKHAYGIEGGSVTVTGIAKNNGSFAFTATKCILWYRLGTSGAWTQAGVCFNPADFPITFPAHSKTTYTATQQVASNFGTGTFQWKIEAIGTYDGAAAKSHAGKLTVTIS
jgi:hypothetical protein